jgi:hypothetical protein
MCSTIRISYEANLTYEECLKAADKDGVIDYILHYKGYKNLRLSRLRILAVLGVLREVEPLRFQLLEGIEVSVIRMKQPGEGARHG